MPSPRPVSVTRRSFATGLLAGLCTSSFLRAQTTENVHFNVAAYDRDHILSTANKALQVAPATITSIPAGHKDIPTNHYYSEDVEWFKTDTGSMEHRPGQINPSAFSLHRDAVVSMNGVVASCTAAWRLTNDTKYAQHAMKHLHAWFLDDATRMEPQLDHAACVPPSTTGTYRGVEDTVMLAETVRAASFLCAYNGVATENETKALRKWFSDFVTWLNESKPGFIAREMKDRTAICWTMQAAEMARFTHNEALLIECGHRFRDKLLRQMNFDGQFPIELHTRAAYAASIFTLDCLSVACEVLSTPMESLWEVNLPDGRGMRSAIAYLFPYMQNRSQWKLPADTEHFRDWPVRQPSLLFAGRAYDRPEYIALWKQLPIEPSQPALLRWFSVRQPALWTVRPPA